MKNQFVAASVFALLLGTLPAGADTITLKDGTELTGTIKKGADGKIKKADGFYEIEYNVNKSGSIKDVKRVPVDSVAKVIEVRPDEIEFAELAKLVPTPDLLTAEDYAARIRSVKAFLTKYPTGTRLKEANALLAKLNSEAAVVTAGGRKVEGLLISGSDFRANAYDMDARLLEVKIRQAETAGRPLELLRAFAELDANFQPSNSFRTVRPLVVKTLQSLRTQVTGSLASYDTRMEKRAADLEAMSGEDAVNVKRAIEQETAQLEARYQAEKAAGQAWVTPHKDHRQSLEDCASLIDSELSRLTGPDAAAKPAADPGKAYRDAWKAIRGGEAEAVEKAFADAQTAGLPEKYTAMLQEAAKAEGIKLGGES